MGTIYACSILSVLPFSKASALHNTRHGVGVFLATERPHELDNLSNLARMTFIQRSSSHELDWTEPIQTLPLLEAGEVGKELSLILLDTRQDEHPLSALYPYALTTPLLRNELAALMSLPQEEYPGYRVREEAKFSVYMEDISSGGASIEVGVVCDRGEAIPGVSLRIPLDDLTGHTLIAGVTGSGKTTTCQGLLLQLARQGVHFLIIEPAKTEYRALMMASELRHALTGPHVFTLGNEVIAPFRVNPFEILPGVNVQTHVDLLKDLITTAFTMWGPLPQLIEWALIDTYQERGWDLVRGLNAYDPQWELPELTPTLDDFYGSLQKAAIHFGYAGEIGANIRAALLARIDSLRRGARGMMLNTRTSVPMEMLLEAPALLELKDVGDDGDKAFIMGLILIRLYEWLDAKHRREPITGLKHVVVIEEAHRLFRSAGSPISNEYVADPRAKAVETFSNIMSEVRAYGEGLVIIDQIPTRLAPDAIKNTNNRIIHRIVSRDDRDFIGLSINVPPEELDVLTGLPRGQVLFHRDGMVRPAHLRIAPGFRGTVPSDDLLKETMTYTIGPQRQYLWRNSGCRYCRRPCTFLSDTEIVRRTFDKELNTLSRMLLLALVAGSPDRAGAALGFAHSEFTKWLHELAPSLPSEEVIDTFWCALWAAMTAETAFPLYGLSKARQEHRVKELLAKMLDALFQMKRTAQAWGTPHDTYVEQRELFLTELQELNRGQCGTGTRTEGSFATWTLHVKQLPLDASTLSSPETLIKWSVQKALEIWKQRGGEEALKYGLLQKREKQRALVSLSLCIFWQRFVEQSDTSVLDKANIFSYAVSDVEHVLEDYTAKD